MLVIIDIAAAPAKDDRFRQRAGRPILDEVGDVHWHLLDLSVVEGFNVLQRTTVINGHEVDGYALTTKSAAATNPVQQYTVCNNESNVPLDKL